MHVLSFLSEYLCFTLIALIVLTVLIVWWRER